METWHCARLPEHGTTAVGLTGLACASAAFAEINFDTSKLGAPAQNKEATDLPSTFFKTGQPDFLRMQMDTPFHVRCFPWSCSNLCCPALQGTACKASSACSQTT